MFEGVYEWLKLFFTHTNTLSSLAPKTSLKISLARAAVMRK
jgi:hypothetical protein